MATPGAVSRAVQPRGDEADALYGVVMAVSAASGGMIAAFAAVQGELAIILLPTLALLAALVRHADVVAAWSGLLVWAVVLVMAPGLAILAPMVMVVLCLAFAIGPDRMLNWIRDEWTGRMGDEPVEVGWIEDDVPR